MTDMPGVEAVLADVLNLPDSAITDEVTMKDLDEWDSLKHMELIAALEETYEIDLTFDEIVSMRDVASIRRVVQSHTGR